MLRATLLASNVIVLAVIVVVVLQSPHSTGVAKPTALASATQISSVANPLDQLSSANIALTVARLDSLPETAAISNQAESQAADLAITSSSGDVISKPQVVATALKSRADIQTYTTKAGDTISTLASQFGVTSNSILWSNGLSGDTVTAGTNLVIPPVNGIVYTVKSGDTPDSLATKFKANKDQIIAYNDAEIDGLKAGEQILIPNGTQAAVVVAASSSLAAYWGGAIYGYNGYDSGYCTWYVATQISVPSNWGNASSWAYYARLSGWTVTPIPQVGAIAQTPYAAGGEGHVAIVDAVSADGSQIQIRDMNGIAGFGRVGYSGWIAASIYPNYIYQ
jgi:surface antigen